MAEETEAPLTGSPSETSERQALTEKDDRLKQLETANKEMELRLKSQVSELENRDKEIARWRESLVGAAVKYRQLLLSSSPEMPEELVKGETVEEVEASFAQARQLVERVRRGLEAKLQQERMPAGAPPRSPLDLSSLSPQEKIAHALARR